MGNNRRTEKTGEFDPLWGALHDEVVTMAEKEPMLASYLHSTVLKHSCLEDSLSYLLAGKLESSYFSAMALREVIDEALSGSADIREAIRRDLQAVVERDPAARGVFFGLTLHHTKYHIHRAILESIVYAFKHHAEVIREMGHPVGRILAVDQGARSDLWRQITADIFGEPVWRVHGGDLGSVYGTALVAGVAAQFWNWGTIHGLSQAKVANRPRSECHAVYGGMYQIYRDLYRHLKEDFSRLSHVGAEKTDDATA